MQIVSRNNVPLIPAWLRRLGLGGFVFFLVKGVLWLTVPYLAIVSF
jgi:hypothetical protein